jgi:hypothetical protein
MSEASAVVLKKNAKSLFSFKIFDKMNTIALLFVIDKYYQIKD